MASGLLLEVMRDIKGTRAGPGALAPTAHAGSLDIVVGTPRAIEAFSAPVMSNTWVVDLRHYLKPGGALAEMPGRARRLAEYWTEIVAQASNFDEPITLRCRRRPGRRACAGTLEIGFDRDFSAIIWCCTVCGDNGVISGWQGSFWDNSDTPEFYQ